MWCHGSEWKRSRHMDSREHEIWLAAVRGTERRDRGRSRKMAKFLVFIELRALDAKLSLG